MWISTCDSQYITDKMLHTIPVSSDHALNFNATVSFDKNVT